MLVLVKKSNLQCALNRCPLDVLKLAGLLPQNLKTNPFIALQKATRINACSGIGVEILEEDR
jgi:hypothetical protein